MNITAETDKDVVISDKGDGGVIESISSGDFVLSNKEDKKLIFLVKDFIYFLEALKSVSVFSIPFVGSRAAVAISNILTGIVYPFINNEAPAAGAIIATLTTSCMGLARNTLLSTSLLIAEADARGQQEEIGAIVIRSWVIGSMYTFPLAGIFLTSRYWTEYIGISENIANEIGNYFVPFSAAILPIFWSASDQQFALVIKRQNITLVAGISYAIFTMSIGYPLALGWPDFIPKLGMSGLGIGAAVAAWINFFGLRLYYLKSEFNKYNLFSPVFVEEILNYKKLLRLGIPLGIQSLLEWSNLLIIAVLGGALGSNVLFAEEVSIQLICAYYFMIQALAQATGVLVSREYAEINRTAEGREKKYILNNMKRFVFASNVIGFMGSAALGAIFMGLPRQLTTLFLGSNNPDFDEILPIAQAMLLINGIGLLFDSVRNVMGGALRGLKDVIFSPILSFLTMSIIGLSTGGVLTLLLDWGAEWLFITRDIGILLAAIGIAWRWLSKSQEKEFIFADNTTSDVVEEPQNISQNSYSLMNVVPKIGCIFSIFPCVKRSNYLSINDDEIEKDQYSMEK